MNIKYLILIGLILTVISLGAVSASDDAAGDNLTTSEELEIESTTDNIELNEESNLPEIQYEDVLATSNEDEPIEKTDEETLLEPSKEIELDADIQKEYFRYTDIQREIKINVSEDIATDIEVYVDNEYQNNIYTQYYYLNTNSLNFGKHYITFYYEGDDTYKELNKTYEFEIVNNEIIIPSTFIENIDSIKVYLPEDAQGTLTINVNGKKYLKENIEDLGYLYSNYREISMDLQDLEFKTMPVEVIYSGDSKYSKISKKADVTFDYDISIEIDGPYKYTTSEKIWVYLPHNIENKPIIKIDETNYDLSDLEDEIYEIPLKIDKLTIGKHNISVTYQDKNHPLKTVTQEFEIIPSLNVDTTISYGETGIINLTSTKESEGSLNITYKLKDSDEEYIQYAYATLVDGKALIEIKDLNVGLYVFNVSYVGDYQNELGDNEYEINIIPNIIIPSKLMTNEKSEIKITANKEYDESITIYYIYDDEKEFEWEIENKEIFGQISLNNGTGTLPLSLSKGNYAFFIKIDDEITEYKTFLTFVRDLPHDAMEFTVSIPEEFLKSYTGEGPYVNIDVPEDSNGIVDIYVDGEYYAKINNDELNSFEFGAHGLSKGSHTVEFRYYGDDYYDDINQTYEIKVVDVTIIIPDEIIVKENDQIYVNLPNNAKGSVSVYIDGVKKTGQYYQNGGYKSYIVDLSDLKIKQHEIEVKFSGDSIYAPVSKKVTVNMTYLISVEVEGKYAYGYNMNEGNNEIRISLPSDIKAKPIVKIDNVNYNLADIDDLSDFTLDITKLSIGNHSIYVSYSDSKYPFKEVNTSFTIVPKIFIDSYIFYGDGGKVTLKLPTNATGSLAVYRTDDYTTTYDESDLYKIIALKNGYVSISIDKLPVGTHYLNAIYTGDDYYVEPHDASVEIKMNIELPTTMIYGQNKYLTLKSDPSDSRTINIYINYNYYGKIKLVNGVGKISLNKLPIGEENELEGYTGDEEHIFSEYIEVFPVPTKITGGKDIKMYYCDGSKYSVKVFGDYGKAVGKGKTVNFKIGTKTIKAKTNAKGVASIKITNTPGKYTITASYNGFKVTNKITVKQSLTLKTAKVKKSSKKLVLKATLKNGKKAIKNKKITFKFNGKKLTAKTNKKGIAKVTIKKSVLKKLKVGKKITYKATYIKNTVKKTVKVKK